MPSSKMADHTRPSRLLSLDVLRGVTIAFMILVNNPGSEDTYAPLKHAFWNGFTPTDLVFPTFLFIVGITTVFSLGSRVDRGDERPVLIRTVLRRALLIYTVGIVASSFPFTNLKYIRYVGVLPRIALCYVVVGLLLLVSRGWKDKVILLAIALVGYWALLRFVPVPGYGVPTHSVPLLDRDGNLAAWVDRAMFAPQHLYERTRDPEGLLSTIPAIGTALMGVLAGMWLRTRHELKAKITGIAGSGAVSVALGLLWNFTLPINKKMWTSSYVLFAGGLSLLLLALMMLLVDLPSATEAKEERSRRSAFYTPWLVFGTNAIAAYVLADVLEASFYSIRLPSGVSIHRAIWGQIHGLIANPPLASLTYSISFVLLCWLLIYGLYRKRIFLKI